MKTQEERKEYTEKAHLAALNIKYAVNKKLAVHSFLRLLYLSI